MERLYHADDFGITPRQSRAILACSDKTGGTGALNSLSVIATSPSFDECVRLLSPYAGNIQIGVHLNVVEGPSCLPASEISLLVDDGVFCLSFVQMLAMSMSSKRAELKRQLTRELDAQIARVVAAFPQLHDNLRIDSHQHFHLIPVVFEAVLDVVAMRGYKLEYLRIPAEPHLPFLEVPRLYFTYRPVNLVKKLVLNALWWRDRGKYNTDNIPTALFCGILLSGKMDEERLRALIPRLEATANKRSMKLELLFHPGGVSNAEECLNPHLRGFVEFYTSNNRTIEAQTLRTLR